MTKRWLKWTLIGFGVSLFVIAGLILFLAIDFKGDSENLLIRQSTSPDGTLVAEVRGITTPMHGGPDLVQVTVGPATSGSGDVIYSQNFECGPDYKAFQMEWVSARALVVSYGSCDTGRFRSTQDNVIVQKSTVWREVGITYRDSGYVAQVRP